MIRNEEVVQIIGKIIPGAKHITPIGNHNLERHQVYSIEFDSKKLVLKLYYVANRWNREVSALKMLSSSEVKVPKLYSYGIREGVEWLLYEYKEGIVLNKVVDKISQENLRDILYAAGAQLGMIHSNNIYPYFGPLTVDLDYVGKFNTYSKYFHTEIQRVVRNLNRFEHKEINLIKDSKQKLFNSLKELDRYDIKGRLCHNDYDARNILVEYKNDKYFINKIIDFEQSVISDADRDLLFVYKRLCNEKVELINIFNKSYKNFMDLDLNKIELKKQVYDLYRGLSICGWSQKVDPSHYEEGIDLLKSYT